MTTGSSDQSEEKRLIERRHLAFYLRVFDGMSSRIVGNLVDISPKGVMVLSDERVAVNEDYRLRMRLPAEVVKDEELIFSATSRWCQKDVNPDFYLIGFQINDMEPETRLVVEQLISDFGFQD
ncbi:MAG: PilZ domain-containing protein [Thermodesulfobacteriota bacterium]